MASLFQKVKKDLQGLADQKKAQTLMRFFKTGPGEYGEGDKFIGVTVPLQRQVAKKYYKDILFAEIKELLKSPIHEYRLTALLMLTYRYERTDDKARKEIFELYLGHTKYINNWDLVDLSAPNIVGAYLCSHPGKKKILTLLAKSENLWEKRISVLATYAFIKKGDFDDILKIATTLLADEHDLIHKAVGWMLREMGKRDQLTEEKFLQKYYTVMPRTMLRYAIEKFDEELRQKYLKNKI